MSNGLNGPLEITAMRPSDLAAVLQNAYRRRITEQQVLEVARAGNLLAADGTVIRPDDMADRLLDREKHPEWQGDPSCLSLFGRDEKLHRLLAEHLTAEFRIKTTARDRTVDEWKLRATRPDNRWFDCLVGAAVAASIQGAALSSLATRAAAPRQRIKLSALQRGGQ